MFQDIQKSSLQHSNFAKREIDRVPQNLATYDANVLNSLLAKNQNHTKRSSGYLSNLAYINFFMNFNVSIRSRITDRESTIFRLEFNGDDWDDKDIDNINHSDRQCIDDCVKAFYKNSYKILNTMNSDEKNIVLTRTKKILEKVLEQLNGAKEPFSPEIVAIYVLSVRFTEIENIHDDFSFFKDWNSYDKFFDCIEHNIDIDIEKAYNIAESVKDII
jgi:hypothetical protein